MEKRETKRTILQKATAAGNEWAEWGARIGSPRTFGDKICFAIGWQAGYIAHRDLLKPSRKRK